MLKLTTPIIKPDIPATYFAPVGQDVELAYRKSLSNLLSNYPDSPMTPGIQMRSNLAPIINQYQQMSLSPNVSRFPPNQNNNSNRCRSSNNNFLGVPQQDSVNNLNLSPKNTSTNTSGYHSFSSSTNSLEQLFPPYDAKLMGINAINSPENSINSKLNSIGSHPLQQDNYYGTPLAYDQVNIKNVQIFPKYNKLIAFLHFDL